MSQGSRLVIKATREIGDIGGQSRTSKREEQEARAAIEPRPQVACAPQWPTTRFSNRCPSRRWHPSRRTATPAAIWNNGHQDLPRARPRRRAGTGPPQEGLRADHRRRARRRADELERLRSRRDTGWSIIRRRHVEGIAVPDEEALAFSPADELPQAFEAAMRDADEAADQRFEKSEAAARLAVIGRQISEQNDLLDSLAAEEKGLAEERGALDAAWMALWAATPVAPQDPDVMIQWLRARSPSACASTPHGCGPADDRSRQQGP